MVLFRGSHSVDRWPSRTSARNPVPPGLLAGVECGFGCLASFPLPSLHPSLGTYSPPGLCNQLVQSPRASTHPTSGKPSFLPASLISSPPLPFNPTAVPYTHTHTQRDFLNLIFKTKHCLLQASDSLLVNKILM